VAAGRFNVLCTTYEFIMRDRKRLARIDWKYIVIDEAQRLKVRLLDECTLLKTI
jgi:SWI/SNF-related matrix-associated actin-dependent regulator of chromatin subfamily A protein 2/4